MAETDATDITYTGQEIAVTGLSIRINNAENIGEFWDKLKKGYEFITFYTDEELIEAGQKPELLRHPNYVKAGSILEGKEYFDAGFFGYTPREAELLDPQVRLFHECAWTALEDSGIDPETYPGLIGVYAGASENLEWQFRALSSDKAASFGGFGATRLTGIRYLCTRLSYNLNLKGPSVSMQTACSTSLVAIHMAGQALLNGECDVAIAGGVTVSARKKHGYIYEEHMILSSDGHNRSFDAAGNGTIFGEGAGVVVLKNLEDAQADGDEIYAIIKSSAINNDGNRKVGFTAPSVEAQVEMMTAAYHLAGITPDTIGLVEAHGTATHLGDPIEIEALRQAFDGNVNNNGNNNGNNKGKDNQKAVCLLGSVKSNLGHLDAASGVAGFIKAVLAVKHGEIPPTLHFKTPNPELKLEKSPFRVNTELTPWQRNGYPRRAAVNSLGMGGTNAHVVLEEPPERETAPTNREDHLIVLSGKTEYSLDRAAENQAEYFKKNPGIMLADAAYTLQTRRKRHPYRKTLVCRNVEDAVDALTTNKKGKVRRYYSSSDNKKIVFMFPGQGTQYVGMCRDLYRSEEQFRREMDRCFEILDPLQALDLKEILYPDRENEGDAGQINNVQVTPTVVFMVEYSLARLLMSWGITPDAMIGHSFGEYAAACLAGVFSLEDALRIITERSKLMSELPPGIMLSVPLPMEQVQPLLPDEISLAIDNGPTSIVAGPEEEIAAFEKELKKKKLITQRVLISVASHSKAIDTIAREFEEKIRTATLNEPKIPFTSNVTGTWITGEEAVDPEYWAGHLRGTVRFAGGLKEILKEDKQILLEVGPGNVLSGIAYQLIDGDSNANSNANSNVKSNKSSGIKIMHLLRNPHQDISDVSFLLDKIGKLWMYGQTIDWAGFYKNEKRNGITMPPYAFDRQRYWIEDNANGNIGALLPSAGRREIKDWFHTVSWSRSAALKRNHNLNHNLNHKNNSHKNKTGALKDIDDDRLNWLLFLDDGPLNIGEKLEKKLESKSRRIVTVRIGEAFDKTGDNRYTVNPADGDDYRRLLEALDRSDFKPHKILHLWGVTGETDLRLELDIGAIDDGQNKGVYSLLYLVRAITAQYDECPCEIIVVTDDMQKVTGEEHTEPIKSTVLGPVYVIPQEHAEIACRSVDIGMSDITCARSAAETVDLLAADCMNGGTEKITAYRKGFQWKQTFERIELTDDAYGDALKEKGVYMITGGLGGVGLTIAEELVRACKARLVLTGRSQLPPRSQWETRHSNRGEQDKTGRIIQKIMALEESGGEVFYAAADVSDAGAMENAVKKAEETFGPINGVIHAAGGTKGESIGFIRNLDRRRCEHQFKAKINGQIILDRMFKDRDLDFLLLTSSMTSYLGGWEYAAYTAANFFLDRFVQETNRWICVNLDPLNLEGDKNPLTTINAGELVQVFRTVVSNVKSGQILTSVSSIRDRILKATRPLKEQPGGTTKSGGEKDSPQFKRPGLTTPYQPPTNDIEARLVEILQALFGYDKIGIVDSFFELGGNSLTIIRFINEVHKRFDTRIQVNDVFKAENIRQLAKKIREAGAGSTETYESIEPAEEKEYYPLSPAQKRLFIVQRMEETTTGYNLLWRLESNTEIDKDRLETTFRDIIRRHESLRTTFHIEEGEPVQKVHQNVDFRIARETAAREADAGDIVRNFIKPFDLSIAPQLRVGVITVGTGKDTKEILLVDMHHIVCDWISSGIFVSDFTALYAGGTLPPLKLQYKDYAEWLNKDERREAVRKQEEFWQKQYGTEVPPLTLPVDFPREEIQGREGEGAERLEFDIGGPLSRRIREMSASTGTTLFMTLSAAYALLLSIYAGTEDLVVGVPVAGRKQEELKNIMGMFVNMLPLRYNPQPDKTFRRFLTEVKQNFIQAFENQDYPFEDLVSKLNIPRRLDRQPLVETVFTLQNAQGMRDNANNNKVNNKDHNNEHNKDHNKEHNPENETGIMELNSGRHEVGAAKFDLTLDAMEKNDTILMWLTYSKKLFKPNTIEKIKNHYVEVLEQAVKNVDIKIEDITVTHEIATADTQLIRDDGEDFGF